MFLTIAVVFTCVALAVLTTLTTGRNSRFIQVIVRYLISINIVVVSTLNCLAQGRARAYTVVLAATVVINCTTITLLGAARKA